MNTTTTRIRRRNPAAIALLIVLGLAGCAGVDSTADRDAAPHDHPASVKLPLDQQRMLNLLVNDNDPRGLHGATSIGGGAAVRTSDPVVNDDDPRGLHGVTKRGRVTSIDELRAGEPSPTPQPRRRINDDDPRGLHGVTSNGW